MTKLLVIKNHEGVFVFQGILIYETLQKNWKDLLASFFLDHETHLILDLEHVKQVDSSFLAFLLAVLRRAHRENMPVKVHHITEDIKNLMQVQGVWPLFQRLI